MLKFEINVDEKTADVLREIAQIMQSTPEKATEVVVEAYSEVAKEYIEKIYKAGVLDE